MLQKDIIRIAAQNGWRVKIISTKRGFSYDFQRRTLGGVPFTFTAELSGYCPGTLVEEILSFVDELNPECLARELLEASGLTSPTRYFRAVADIDEIRNRAFLLAFDLAEAVETDNFLFDPPDYIWN